ncbi:MAG: PAS domain S-box protein [Archaeoglobaceae archaeon]
MVRWQGPNRELKLAEVLPFAIILTDEDYRVMYWSEKSEELLGWAKDEVEGQPLYEVLQLSEEEIQNYINQDMTRILHRKDGSTVRCDVKSTSFDKKYAFFLRDVTHLFEEKKELESYQDFFENAQDMFFRIGKTEFNPKLVHTLGYSKPELTGIPLNPLVHPEDLPVVRDEFFRVLNGETRNYELRMLSKSGDILWFEVLAWPWKSGGVTVGSEGVLRDISERKKREASSERLLERLEVLNSILRHDLSNYLTVIGNYMELLEEEANKEYINKIQNMVKRSLELINDIKIVEQAEKTGKIMKSTNLSDVLKSEINAIEDPNTSIKSDISEGLYVWADEMVNSIFSNLLSNSITHNDKEEKIIEVTAKKLNSEIEVKIADNGPGVPEDMRKDIFKEGVKDEVTGKTGMGLFLAKTLVERYKGSVWVEENQPEGSIFYVRLRSSENLYGS